MDHMYYLAELSTMFIKPPCNVQGAGETEKKQAKPVVGLTG